MSKHGVKASVRKLRITLHNLDINISFGAEIKYIFFFYTETSSAFNLYL